MTLSPTRPPDQPLFQRVFQPIDQAPLVLFRIALGALAAIEMVMLLTSGWVERNIIIPPFHFTYDYFDWVRPLPGAGSIIHVAVLAALAVMISAGLLYRWACVLFCVGFAWLFLIDKSHYLNHFYLIGLLSFLLCFIPAHRELSLDALLGRVQRGRTTSAGFLWLVRAQFALVYFYGGIAKLNGDWLHGEPMRQWLAERAGVWVPASLAGETWFVLLFAWSGMLIDMLIVPLLLWRRTRPAAFAFALLFHLMNSQLWTIGVFPWLMIAGTAMFFPPERFRRAVDRLRRVGSPETRQRAAGALAVADIAPPNGRDRTLATALAIYFVIQCLVPLRHLLYPGSYLWNGEGVRFAWTMLHRRTTAAVVFEVRDGRSGQTWAVDPREYLTLRQAEQMAARPDMLLQFAHALADGIAADRGTRPEVRAKGLVSLNGRPPQPMVDPQVDLAREPRGFAPAKWIVPLASPLPERPAVVAPSEPQE